MLIRWARMRMDGCVVHVGNKDRQTGFCWGNLKEKVQFLKLRQR